MRQKFCLTTLGALLLPLLAVPAMAQGKGVNCMRSEYSVDQLDEMTELGGNLRIGSEIDQRVFDRIGEIALTAIQTCMARHGWTEEQTLYASFYELGRVNEAAYRASGDLSVEQLRQLDAALATGNRDRLWEAVENGVRAGMAGDPAGSNAADAMTMGNFVIEAGLVGESDGFVVAVRTGLLLGFMSLQRIGLREFTALGR